MHQHTSNHHSFLQTIVAVVAVPMLFCSSAARAADDEAAKAAAHEAQEAAARVVAAAKAKTTQAHLEGWEMGPFVKHPEPVLRPNPESVFNCPIMGKGIRWEEMNTYNPAAVVKDGKVYWKCLECGYIVEASKAPERCPVCDHPQGHFEIWIENY